MNPQETPHDDTICVRCHAKLPDEVEPGSPQDEGFCDAKCQSGERVVINTIQELAAETEAYHDTKESIAKRLYKDTSCGISFWVYPTEFDLRRMEACDLSPDFKLNQGVGVSGYCEGTDRECPNHTLDFPFTADAFWEAVKQADQDGCDTWGETHGCAACGTDSYECECCVRDGCLECNAERPINPECKSCQGHGVVI